MPPDAVGAVIRSCRRQIRIGSSATNWPTRINLNRIVFITSTASLQCDSLNVNFVQIIKRMRWMPFFEFSRWKIQTSHAFRFKNNCDENTPQLVKSVLYSKYLKQLWETFQFAVLAWLNKVTLPSYQLRSVWF